MKTSKILTILFLFLLGIAAVIFAVVKPADTEKVSSAPVITTKPAKEDVQGIPKSKILPFNYHVFQTFNNCAPAALSIALSYYGIHKSQELLASELRPYNNKKGLNDDKSTTPDELGAKAEKYGLTFYYRPNGNIELLKKLIANDFPVLMRTLLEADEDFAHYRVIKGYDDTTREIIQDDSYQGKNKRYSYDDFMEIWKPFNYEYLVLVPPEKRKVIEAILGEELDEKIAWENASQTAGKELSLDSSDTLARLNLSVSLYYVGDFAGSVREFEKIENDLPRLTLWYRIEPIRAYAALGNSARLFGLSDKILRDGNPAFSELYLLRGESYKGRGNIEAAKNEFEKALLYNSNLKSAQEALASVSN